MNILLFSNLVPYPLTSGVLLRCYNLLREVARHHRIFLYAFNQTVLLKSGDPLAASVRHLEEFCAEVRVFPIPTEQSRAAYAGLLARNLLSADPYLVPRFASAPLRAAAADLLRREQIDLVQFETLALAPYGALAPALPQVLIHQNVESKLLARRAEAEANPAARWYLGVQARKVRRYEIACFQRVGAHVAVSPSDREDFLAMAPGARVHVVENGTDTAYFRAGPDPAGSAPNLIFVGGMSWYPNRDGVAWFLRDVWPRIRRERPDATVTFVGSHPSAGAVAAAAADPEHVTVTGLVEDIRPLVQAAAVFFVPLLVGGGTRLKVLDAWAMQKAVLSTSVGCEGLHAEAERDVCVADTPEAFAAAAVALLADRERRLRLGCAGRARVEQEFAWPQLAQGMLDLYTELVPEPAAVPR